MVPHYFQMLQSTELILRSWGSYQVPWTIVLSCSEAALTPWQIYWKHVLLGVPTLSYHTWVYPLNLHSIIIRYFYAVKAVCTKEQLTFRRVWPRTCVNILGPGAEKASSWQKARWFEGLHLVGAWWLIRIVAQPHSLVHFILVFWWYLESFSDCDMIPIWITYLNICQRFTT